MFSELWAIGFFNNWHTPFLQKQMTSITQAWSESPPTCILFNGQQGATLLVAEDFHLCSSKTPRWCLMTESITSRLHNKISPNSGWSQWQRASLLCNRNTVNRCCNYCIPAHDTEDDLFIGPSAHCEGQKNWCAINCPDSTGTESMLEYAFIIEPQIIYCSYICDFSDIAELRSQ